MPGRSTIEPDFLDERKKAWSTIGNFPGRPKLRSSMRLAVGTSQQAYRVAVKSCQSRPAGRAIRASNTYRLGSVTVGGGDESTNFCVAAGHSGHGHFLP